MKYKGSLNIHQSRDKLVAIFMDASNLKEHQDGFVKKELEHGNVGENGAISKMYYKHGKRDMILTETILNNNLPQSFEAHYHHKHMDNTMKYTFIKIDEYQTRYDYECEYIRINWVLPKLMALVFPGMYRKQVEKWMQQFKVFAEKQ
ncbi:SRPBCC family protein [Aquimarina sp. AU474]|uniref:SRPBCC family protein n=1 Tax=Aquimarina sp. AU474 TaxID=2108529 RepID=UPI000D694C46|nr:SRPBCC family protein [Aquimarina sp. AU474]